MDLVEIIKLAELHLSQDIYSKVPVRKANRTATKLRSKILEILSITDGAEQLMSLLNHPAAGPWIAFTALEHGTLNEFQSARCLAIVRKVANGNKIDSAGAKLWLKLHGYQD
ncbi:MAG: hypothetical protein QM719_05615 [Thermomonas sp.]